MTTTSIDVKTDLFSKIELIIEQPSTRKNII